MSRVLSSIIFFILVLNIGVQAQQSVQLLFDEANTLLENSNYAEAMKMYRTIEAGEQVSGALFLNLGIASTQIDSMGLAKYYFLKAARFESTKESALEALEYVESQFSRQSATLPKLPWDKAVDWLKEGLGSFGVFLIGFIFIFLSVSLVILNWFSNLSLKKLNTIVSSCSIVGILILVLSFYVDYVDQRYSEGVIITNEIQVRQNANSTSDLVSLGYEGYSITIDNKLSSDAKEWLYIRLGNGQFGWVEKSGVKIL